MTSPLSVYIGVRVGCGKERKTTSPKSKMMCGQVNLQNTRNWMQGGIEKAME